MIGEISLQLEQLKYIIVISFHKNISKAAKELNLSQSALSQSVLKLENELNVQIFNRSRNGVSVTDKGAEIINLAKTAIKKIELIESYALQNTIVEKENFKIGIIDGLHLPFMPALFAELKKEFSKLNILLVELSSINIIKALLNDEIDLGILAIYEKTKPYRNKIKFTPINKINMYVFLPKHSELATKKKLTPHDLKDETYITYNGEFMNWFFNKYREQYNNFDELLQTRNNETISETVKSGLAVAIEVENELYNNPYIKSGEIIAKPLILNEHFKENYIGLACSNKKRLSPSMLKFSANFERLLKELAER